MHPRARRLAASLLAASGSVLACSDALAVGKSWVGGTGNWNVAANWFPGSVPFNGDTVFLTSSDTVSRTVTYVDTSGIFLNNFPVVVIDAFGGGSMFLNHSNGLLFTDSVVVGVTGQGQYDLS